MKIFQSLFKYVGNPLYRSDNALEAGVWRVYWNVPKYPQNNGFSAIIT
jgi:hypothetical protein